MFWSVQPVCSGSSGTQRGGSRKRSRSWIPRAPRLWHQPCPPELEYSDHAGKSCAQPAKMHTTETLPNPTPALAGTGLGSLDVKLGHPNHWRGWETKLSQKGQRLIKARERRVAQMLQEYDKACCRGAVDWAIFIPKVGRKMNHPSEWKGFPREALRGTHHPLERMPAPQPSFQGPP